MGSSFMIAAHAQVLYITVAEQCCQVFFMLHRYFIMKIPHFENEKRKTSGLILKALNSLSASPLVIFKLSYFFVTQIYCQQSLLIFENIPLLFRYFQWKNRSGPHKKFSAPIKFFPLLLWKVKVAKFSATWQHCSRKATRGGGGGGATFTVQGWI